MKSVLLWVVTYEGIKFGGFLSNVFTNKDDAVNVYEIRCSDETADFLKLEKVRLKGKTTRDLACSCVQYGAHLNECTNVYGPGVPAEVEIIKDRVAILQENAIATQPECV